VGGRLPTREKPGLGQPPALLFGPSAKCERWWSAALPRTLRIGTIGSGQGGGLCALSYHLGQVRGEAGFELLELLVTKSSVRRVTKTTVNAEQSKQSTEIAPAA
jgi:hypothetical protein